MKRAIAALQQSHYSLTVDASQIDMERRITVAAEDEPIENVLAQIFAGQDVSYEINGRSIVVTRRAVPRVAEKASVADAERRGARRQGRHDRGGDGRRQGDDHRRDDRHRRPLFRCACRRTIPCCRFRSWATGRPKWRSHRRRRSWT
ncbi:MAG: STN domain-containing protein [Alistipes communis]